MTDSNSDDDFVDYAAKAAAKAARKEEKRRRDKMRRATELTLAKRAAAREARAKGEPSNPAWSPMPGADVIARVRREDRCKYITAWCTSIHCSYKRAWSREKQCLHLYGALTRALRTLGCERAKAAFRDSGAVLPAGN